LRDFSLLFRNLIYCQFFSAQVPGAPSNPFVTITSATSVSLTWVPRSNGGSPITSYKVAISILLG